MAAVFIIPLFILLAISFRLFAGSLDRGRIEHYVRHQGGRVVSINWSPFGRGWFGSNNERIYEVVYYNAHGDQHFATCKTSMWSGVYWTEDRIAHPKAAWEEDVIHNVEDLAPLIQPLPTEAAEASRLRSAAAVELWQDRLEGAVVAIGNAPTALFHLLNMLEDPTCPRPAAILGCPEGFVGARESKDALWAEQPVPSCIVEGRLGGSAITVAAINAIASRKE